MPRDRPAGAAALAARRVSPPESGAAAARGIHLLGTCAIIALCVGCYARAAAPGSPDPDPERARAALATLHVDNRTTQRLAIVYRLAVSATGEVRIGHVDAGSDAEMAPVPAGEPLILTARTAEGAELTLPPRTFAMDGEWTWVVEPGSRFVPPPSGTR